MHTATQDFSMNQGLGKHKLLGRLSAAIISLLLSQGAPVWAQSKPAAAVDSNFCLPSHQQTNPQKPKRAQQDVSYSQFLCYVETGRVSEVEIFEKKQLAEFRLKGQAKDEPALTVALICSGPATDCKIAAALASI